MKFEFDLKLRYLTAEDYPDTSAALDMLKAAAAELYASCPPQDALLIQARAFEFGMTLMNDPAALWADFEAKLAALKVDADVEVPTVEVPDNSGIIAFFANLPSMEEWWALDSIIAAMKSGRYSPMSWIGDAYASINAAADPGYTRIAAEPPQDLFYGIIPWAYELYWQTNVYPWEPVWTWMASHFAYMLSLSSGDMSLFAHQKWIFKEIFEFDAQCPDIMAGLGPKAMRVSLALPAWFAYIFLFIFRFIAVIDWAIFYILLYVFDFFFGIYVAIRNWIHLYIVLPIWEFQVWLFNAIMFLLSIPYYVIKLTIQWMWAVQQLILTIIWSIMLPIIQFFIWLVMFIPNLIIEYVLTPIWWALFWLFGWLCEIAMFIPEWIFFNISIPILEFFMWLDLQLYLYLGMPIANFFIWIQLTIQAIIIFLWQLILVPLDLLCAWFYGLVDQILDAILAIVTVPEWQPAWGMFLAFPIMVSDELAKAAA